MFCQINAYFREKREVILTGDQELVRVREFLPSPTIEVLDKQLLKS